MKHTAVPCHYDTIDPIKTPPFNSAQWLFTICFVDIPIGQLHVLPIRKDQKLNIIPVDSVAETAVKIAFDPEAEKDTLHSSLLPENLYIADATLLPKAMGNPPILTIMALAKRIASLLQ